MIRPYVSVRLCSFTGTGAQAEKPGYSTAWTDTRTGGNIRAIIRGGITRGMFG
jgi:hypothetical protein